MVRSEAKRAHRWERAPGQPEGLGTAPLGNLFTEVQEPDADATIDAALGAGATFVDTAPHYGLGVAERRLGPQAGPGASGSVRAFDLDLVLMAGRYSLLDQGALPS
jgi:hypothetical protein